MSRFNEYNAIMQEALEEALRRGETGIQVAGYLDGKLLFSAAAGFPSAVGAYGYWLAGEGDLAHPLLGASAHILQHPGAGDSLTWAELDSGLAVSICHNAMRDIPEEDPETMAYRPIVDAARRIRDLEKSAKSTSDSAAADAEIRNLLAGFAVAADAGADVTTAAAHFTDDGNWDLGGEITSGRDGIAGLLQGMRDGGFAGPGTGTRHVLGAPLVSVNGDEATARTYWMLVKGGEAAGVLAVGEYEDQLQRSSEGRWLIASRTVHS